MKSICPKCQAQIELDLPSLPESGTRTSCPACNAKLYVHKESFGARAFRKTGQISCAACGDQLGHGIYCQGCHRTYPDYLVVGQGTKPALLPKTEAKSGDFSLPLPSARLNLPQITRAAKTGETAKKPKNLAAVVAVLLVLALVAGGYNYFSRIQAEKAYVDSFVKLTYCIHSGEVRSKEAATKIATEWKASNGQRSAPHMPAEDEKDFATLDSQVRELQAKTATPPEKYRPINEAVAALYASSKKMQDLAVSPSPTLNGFVDTTAKLDAEYQKKARDFKTALPEEVVSELKSASKRYKALQTLL